MFIVQLFILIVICLYERNRGVFYLNISVCQASLLLCFLKKKLKANDDTKRFLPIFFFSLQYGIQ